ncbi:hypothetical protein HQ403_01520 [Candidatus Kaiserbacteria bacterium]|nr:hypothetical protein [Candidatus Kaiserbacteria bacterium]
MTSPKISFIYAYPLDAGRRRLFTEKGLDTYPTIEKIKEVLKGWENTWNEVNSEDKVMSTLVKITKRVPTRALECFVFGGGLNPMSTPFLMPVVAKGGKIRSDEKFIETVIHELLHIFVTENTFLYWTMIREKYSDEDVLTQNHIIIYAMLQEVYELLFEKLPPDFSQDGLPPGYMRAIELVKKIGHKNLIEEYHTLVK